MCYSSGTQLHHITLDADDVTMFFSPLSISENNMKYMKLSKVCGADDDFHEGDTDLLFGVGILSTKTKVCIIFERRLKIPAKVAFTDTEHHS